MNRLWLIDAQGRIDIDINIDEPEPQLRPEGRQAASVAEAMSSFCH